MYDIRQRSMLDGRLFTLAGLAKRTGRRRVQQRCAGLNRTGLAGPPQDGPDRKIILLQSFRSLPTPLVIIICPRSTIGQDSKYGKAAWVMH